MKTDKTKCLKDLMEIAELLYDAERLLDTVKVSSKTAQTLSAVAKMLQDADQRLKRVLDDDWWI